MLTLTNWIDMNLKALEVFQVKSQQLANDASNTLIAGIHQAFADKTAEAISATFITGKMVTNAAKNHPFTAHLA